MAVGEDEVARVARLARIGLAPGEAGPLAGELSAIIAWVEALRAVDVAGVQPLDSVLALTMPWRADEVTDGQAREAVLANAPEPRHGHFAVPRVVE